MPLLPDENFTRLGMATTLAKEVANEIFNLRDAASYPTLADATNAGLAAWRSAPSVIEVAGYNAPGDAGAARYAIQPAPIPFVSGNLYPTGFDSWTMVNGWAASNGRLVPVAASGLKITNGSYPVVPGRRYSLAVDVVRTAGSWSIWRPNSRGYSTQEYYGSTATGGVFPIDFVARPGDGTWRVNGSPDFAGSIGITLIEYNDQGQQMIMGAQYLPVPLDGILRPEMFGAGFGDNDDVALDRFWSRCNSLAQAGNSLKIESKGHYIGASLTRNLVCVAERANVTWDATGGVLDLSGTDRIAETFWLEFLGPGYDAYVTGSTVKTRLTAALPADTFTTTVADTTGFADGDWATISSSWQYWGGITAADGYQRVNAGELRQIRRVENATTLWLGSGSSFRYDLHGTDPVANPVNVRRIGMAGRFTLIGGGLRVIGPARTASTNREGTAFLNVRHFEDVVESDVTCENFPGYSRRYTLCGFVKLTNPVTLGRKFSIGSSASQWNYGVEILGCAAASVVGPVGEYCRRAIDLHEASLSALAGDVAANEGVIATNIATVGGYTLESQTLPLGHFSYNVTLTGHVAQRSGCQIRGRNVSVIGCRGDRGISLGAAEIIDPDTYPYDEPTQGHVIISGCSFINNVVGSWGMEVRQSISSLLLENSVIVGGQPLVIYGRHQSNITIRNNTIMGIEGATPVNAIIHFANNGTTQASADLNPPDAEGRPYLPQKIDGSDVIIAGNRLRNGTVAILHNGCKVAPGLGNIRIRNNTFENILTHHLQLLNNVVGGNSLWATDGSIELFDNSESTSDGSLYPLPTTKLNVGTVVLNARGNNFVNPPIAATIASSTIALPAQVGGEVINVSLPGTTTNIDNITGLKQGQVVVFSKAGGGTLTFRHFGAGSGNIRSGTDKTLVASTGRIAFMGAASGLVMFMWAVENA